MFLLFIPFCFLFTNVWCWCECIHLFHSVEMIDCVNACLSVCVFWIQRTKSLKKTNSSCIATNTFNDHRAPHTNEHFNTFFAVILSLAFFVCMLVYLATRFGWYWIEVFFLHFTYQAHRPKQKFCLRVSSMFTFHWCGLHTRFGFMTSGVCVLNVLHWTWLNDRFGFLCALHICTTNTLRASDCISNICSVCLLLNGNAFFQAVWCIEPKHCETILYAYTQFNAHLLRRCVLSNRLNEFFSNLNTVFVQKITWKWLKKSQTESMRSMHFSYEQRICLSMAFFFSRLMYFFDFDFYKRKPCVWGTFNDIEKSYINNKHIHQPR